MSARIGSKLSPGSVHFGAMEMSARIGSKLSPETRRFRHSDFATKESGGEQHQYNPTGVPLIAGRCRRACALGDE
ncbi:hypothetical protein OIU79_004196 [Salix purpurea]|uniref:Uncharacterized protein n=1 Tax=Salix purpurea TaxID=77065 RepID=A0A9Q0U9T2_SALPP|nr:hypothetical protein OIU79_004196 [Salix purpurea]